MTELLYFDDCYLKEWDTRIEKTKKNGKNVVLEESAFYPEGGGQPTDKGVLRTGEKEFKVNKVVKKGKDVWHHLEKGKLEKGTRVKAKLDWDRRYAHMRMHTAQHLLSAILLDHYDAATAGNQIHERYSRIDFQPFDPTEDDLEFIVQKFNTLVDKEMSVKKYIVNREKVPEIVEDEKRLRLFNRVPDFVKEIRIVEIEGIDKAPCAGTHVDNTKEIGYLHIRDTENKGKNTTRIVFGLQ